MKESGDGLLERLAEALATVQRTCPEMAVLAIQWMHLKHPLHRVHETLLHEEARRDGTRDGLTARRRGGSVLFVRYVESVLYAGYCWVRLLWLRLWMRRTLTGIRRQSFDLIVKTWVRNIEWADHDDDLYFGDLQRRLAQRQIRMLLLCDNVAGDGWTPFARVCARASWPRLSALCLAPPSAPLRMLAKQWGASRRLQRLAAASGDPLVRRIAHVASRDCLALSTARAGLYYWIGEATVRAWRPRAFLTTYESHGWEQALRLGIKTADPSCCVIGYQHTLLFPEARSMIRPPRIGSLPLQPDVLACLGEVSRRRLQEGHEPFGTRLVSFGSFWYRAANGTQPTAPARRTILVVPEGHPSAVQELLQFVCECAPHMPGHTFLVRRHPVFPMRDLRAMLETMPQQPNVVCSEALTLEEDCARSSAVLYRASSTVLYAVLRGLLPIYLDTREGEDQDPLAELPAWHARCHTPRELAEMLTRHEHTPMERLEADWQLAVQALSDYTGPVTDERLETLLEMVGLNRPTMATTEAIHV